MKKVLLLLTSILFFCTTHAKIENPPVFDANGLKPVVSLNTQVVRGLGGLGFAFAVAGSIVYVGSIIDIYAGQKLERSAKKLSFAALGCFGAAGIVALLSKRR